MHVLLALDSFKGTLTAREACDTVRRGILSILPDADVDLKPMADGGEGTADALMAACGGQWNPARVMGPIKGMEVDAGVAWFPESREALVEMAMASGLPLLNPTQQNPLVTTTFGTGQLLKKAFALPGVSRVLLAVGGSATVDGGLGAAMALGWQFLDVEGRPVSDGGGHLAEVSRIMAPSRLHWPRVEVLCDVTHPLCGPSGAARIFGPQKGASPTMVDQLEQGLEHLADVVEHDLGRDIRTLSGGGAAGGLAAGAVAFMDAVLVPGIETVMAVSGLEEAMREADWVITGEGCFDEQSLSGKVVSGVVKWAERCETNVAVLAGSTTFDSRASLPAGIQIIKSARKDRMSLEDALTHSADLLFDVAQEWAREVSGLSA